MQEGRGQYENNMADRTPVRVVFNASNVATGLAEFQSGDTVPIASGGTGISSIGSAGQVLKVNAAGNALEFGAEGDISITNLVAPSNADLTFTTSGTGNIVLDAITIRGTTINSADSTKININEGVIIDGTLNTSGQATLGGLAYPTSDGTSGQVLQTDGSGTLSFGSVSLGDLSIIGSTIASPSNADLTLDPAGTGDINLTAGADVNIPANIGLTFGDDAEKIEGDGTDLTISGNNINLTAVADVNIPSGVGLTFATAEKIESDGTDLSITVGSNGDINIPANIGLTFGDDGEKIEGDGTDLTITGNNIKLTASADIVLAANTGLVLDGSGDEKIESDGTDISVSVGSGGDINIPANIGITFGDDAEKIEGDGTDLTITGNNIKLTAATDVIIPTNVGLHFTDANEKIESDGSKIIITSGGTAFNFPTSDGSAGEFLKTDGAGTLTFGSAAATVSDDSRAVVKNNKSVGTSARTVDYFQSSGADVAWYFMALNDLTNDHSSASCFTVCHNDTDAFISGARGGASGSSNTLPTTSADISSSQVRVKVVAPSADSKVSYYKIPLSRANTANATSGVTVTTANTDVDSASETIDTFAHASFRAAKYVIVIDDNAKTETGVTEALVVHDGSTAFVAQYGTVNTGNNDMITLSAQIAGSNVVLSGAGLTPNLSLKIHKTLLSDSMTAVSNGNQAIIAATTVSSSATSFDNFDLDDATGALYYVVGGNSTEGHYSVQEVYCAGAPGEASVSQGPFVSTKGTTQLEFTAGFKSDADNSLELSISSTSGGSTTVNAYRINCLAE